MIVGRSVNLLTTRVAVVGEVYGAGYGPLAYNVVYERSISMACGTGSFLIEMDPSVIDFLLWRAEQLLVHPFSCPGDSRSRRSTRDGYPWCLVIRFRFRSPFGNIAEASVAQKGLCADTVDFERAPDAAYNPEKRYWILWSRASPKILLWPAQISRQIQLCNRYRMHPHPAELNNSLVHEIRLMNNACAATRPNVRLFLNWVRHNGYVDNKQELFFC